MPKTLPITLIAQNSSRLRAYLNAFIKSDTLPSRIITLNGGGVPDAVTVEAKQQNYSMHFFDLLLEPQKFYEHNNIPVTPTNSKSINSIDIYKALLGERNEYVIFTGGGIVSKEILEIGKELLHIHPGKLPEYRGSTCFYYSLLQEGTLHASAILLREHIDTGPIVGEKAYSINYEITSDMPNFMDHVLDPYIRGELLREMLEQFAENGTFCRTTQPKQEGRNYYIMHPVLRSEAVRKTNNLYDPSKPLGISSS